MLWMLSLVRSKCSLSILWDLWALCECSRNAPWMFSICSLSDLWPRKMKLDCYCYKQTCAGQTLLFLELLSSCRSQTNVKAYIKFSVGMPKSSLTTTFHFLKWRRFLRLARRNSYTSPPLRFEEKEKFISGLKKYNFSIVRFGWKQGDMEKR